MDTWLKQVLERIGEMQLPETIANTPLPPEFQKNPGPLMALLNTISTEAALHGAVIGMCLLLDFVLTTDKDLYQELDALRKRNRRLEQRLLESTLGKLRNYEFASDSIQHSPESPHPPDEDSDEEE